MSIAADVRMFRPEAIAVAKAFIDLIDDACAQVVVAGSLRRRLVRIGDVEIVVVPRFGPVTVTTTLDLFSGQPATERRDLLDERLERMLASGVVQQRLDTNGRPRWGPTLKYLTFQDTRIDLFCPSAERLGWILLLRTGPAAYSRQLVVARDRRTKDGRRGLRPAHIVPQDGFLTYRTSGERIVTPTEHSVFDLFGLPYREPWERA